MFRGVHKRYLNACVAFYPFMHNLGTDVLQFLESRSSFTPSVP